jgi:hypothetical protein
MTLDQILKNDEPQKVEVVNVEAKAETPEEPKQERPRDEAGRFKGEAKAAEEAKAPPKAEAEKPKAEAKAESATPAPKEDKPEEPVEVRGLKSAHMAEKTKRQEYERQLAALQAELAQLKSPQQQVPDVMQDPQGFAQSLEQRMQTALINERVNLSYAMAKRSHPDFDEVMAEWPALYQQNPAIYQAALQQEMPAEWAYQQVKRMQFLQEVGDDPSTYRTKLEQELRAKWEAERMPEQRPAPVAPPPSLATATSAPVREQQWAGPRSLNSILTKR